LAAQEGGGAGGAGKAGRFKVWEDRDGGYYWHLQAASDRIIAWSRQAYDSKYWCVQDLNWPLANAALIMVSDYTGELAPGPPRYIQPDCHHTSAAVPLTSGISGTGSRPGYACRHDHAVRAENGWPRPRAISRT
jgi:uncharacterized protein YegP (UPF0339 family)